MQGKTTTPAEDSYFTSWKPWVVVTEIAKYKVGGYQQQAQAILDDDCMDGDVVGTDMSGVNAARKNVTTGLGPPETAGAVQVQKAGGLLAEVKNQLETARQGVRSGKADDIRKRTPMTEVVKDAAKPEEELIKELEAARETVRNALPPHPGEGDLATAEERFKEVVGALKAVNDAIVQRQLHVRADEILTDKALMEDAVPGAGVVDKALSVKVASAREEARRALASDATLTDSGVKAEKAKVQLALKDLKEAVAKRQGAAKQILQHASMATPFTDLSDPEKLLFKALEEARTKVQNALPEFPTIEDIEAAEKACDGEVKQKMTNLNKEIVARKQRQEEAKRIRIHNDVKKTIKNATSEDMQAATSLQKELLNLVPEGGFPSAATIKAANETLVKVQAALKAAEQSVQDRAKRKMQAQEIRSHGDMKKMIASASEDDMKQVIRSREEVLVALTNDDPPSQAAVEKALVQLAKVKEALEAATMEVAARQQRYKRATEIRSNPQLTQQAAKGAEEEEIRLVQEAQAAVHKALPQDGAPSPDTLAEAEMLLLKVKGALEAATQAVAEREQRQTRAAEIRQDKLLKQTAAKGASPDEIRLVKDAQEAVSKVLPENVTPTPQALQEAEKLLLKVKDALDAAALGVKTRQEAKVNEIKRTGGQAVEEWLRFGDAEVLTGAVETFGDPSLVGGLIKGCDKGRGRFTAVMDKFKNDPNQANLKALLTKGGFAGRPEVLAHLLDSTFAAQTEAKKVSLIDPFLKRPVNNLSPDQQKAADNAALKQIVDLADVFAKDPDAAQRLQKLLADGGLDRNPEFLGDLLQNGCNGDPAQLVKLTKEFTQPKDLADLKGLLVDAGMSDNPQVFAALLKDGAGGDAAKLKKLTSGYPAPDPVKVKDGDQQAVADAEHLQNFKNLIENGGFNRKPEALATALKFVFDAPDNATDLANFKNLIENGGLADKPQIAAQLLTVGCNGEPAKVKILAEQFAAPEDQANLKGLIVGGGMGRKPEVLATLLKEGCDGDAAKLKKLTSGYPAPDPQKLQQGDPTAVADQKHLQNLKKLVETGGLGDKPAALAKILKVAFDAPDNAPDLANFKNLIENGGLADQPQIAAQVLTVGCYGDPSRIKSLAAQFSQPTDQTNLKGLLADGGLAHKPEILGNIISQVPSGDPPGVMRALAAQFQAGPDRANLKGLIEEGGLGDNPATLGAMLNIGCEAKPDKLKDLTTAYGTGQPTSVQDLQNLKSFITDSGFADDPAALGHLYKTACDGSPDQLKQKEQALRPNKAKVKDLVEQGGMGGATLASVLKTTFNGDAAKLMTLHDTFATDLPGLKKISNAFSGDDKTGERFKRVLGHLKGNGTEAAAVTALKDTFLVKMQGKEHLMSVAAKFHINRGAINNGPNGIPPATLANASLATTNAGGAADVAALAATNAANGNPNIEKTAQETTKAATAAKNAAVHATTFADKNTEFLALQANPPRKPLNPGQAVGDIDWAELGIQSQPIKADMNNAYVQLSQEAVAAKAAATAAKLALESVKRDLKKAQEDLTKQPTDGGLTQKVQELTTGVQMAQQAYDAANTAAVTTKSAQKAAALRDVTRADMAHSCERHTFWKQFTNEPLDHIQSMYPEGTTDVQVAAYIDEALDALVENNAAIPTSASILGEPDGKTARDVYLPNSMFTVRVVFKRIPATGMVEIRGCFPTTLNQIPLADMETIRDALGK